MLARNLIISKPKELDDFETEILIHEDNNFEYSYKLKNDNLE